MAYIRKTINVGEKLLQNRFYIEHVKSEKRCLNCESLLDEKFKFCPECGQDTEDTASSIGGFIKHFLNDYFTFDSKIIRSFTPLLFKPGFLTEEFFEGRRVRYIPPLRMYIFVSVVFFLVLSLLGGSHEAMPDEDRFWNDFFGSFLPKVFFVLLPMFALILFGLYARRKISYVKHFVFSLHFHAFLFILILVYLLISEVFEKLELIIVNQILSPLIGLSFLGYLFIAMKRTYDQNWGKTLLKFFLLCLAYGGILFIVISFSLLIFQSQGN